jgi:protein-tyrosine phosphatase
MPENNPKKILFLCMGNICRSPAGEGVFKKLVQERGLSNSITIDSAGIIGYHTGDPADSRMRAAAKKRGVSLESRARQITRDDLDKFDLIIAMDQENMWGLNRIKSGDDHHAKIQLLCDYIPGKEGGDVPDPYYGGADGFELVLDLIEEATEPILDDLLNLPAR